MKVIHISHSDMNGGAARAAYRIHQTFLKGGIVSEMWVDDIHSNKNPTIKGPSGKFDKFLTVNRNRFVNNIILRLLSVNRSTISSPSILPSKWVKKINDSDADLVHLHWVQNEMLSVADIGKITKPIVWTLHDMWAFCGAEHLSSEKNNRWRFGYDKKNRPESENGFDINLWTWKRKLKHWKKPIQIITPSGWLANCVKESFLMKNWPVKVIPNPINTEYWKPFDKTISRRVYKLSNNVPILLFCVSGGINQYNKGFDLLLKSLRFIKKNDLVKKLELVICGQSQKSPLPNIGFPVRYIGHINDDYKLRKIYSMADLLVVPSRIESFGQVASEAQSCSVPVVSFNNSGLSDIVKHLYTGFLAKAFDYKDLARGIIWVLKNNKEQLGKNARQIVVSKFSEKNVITQYLDIYKNLLK